MSQYLITLSIGPVQDFIAAARKTRDLWFGSWVLSEISKAAAYSIYNKDNDALIFPTTDNPEEKLKPCDARSGYCFNVGNKLLFLSDNAEPSELIKQAKEAAEKRWKDIAQQALDKAIACKIEINNQYWNDQIDDVLEFFAAWVEFDESKSYKDQRERLDQLLNARKNTREFDSNPITDHGVPKSSLDGLRESVIKRMPKNDNLLRRAGIKKSEKLDCVGIVKRLALNPDQFTPISRLAIDPWVRGNKDKNFDTIITQLNELVDSGLCSRVKGNEKIYEDLPYDGQLLYPDRLKTALDDEENAPNKEKLENLKTAIKELDLTKPSPYMVVLLADGDRMGELLDKVESISEHQKISGIMAKFATNVPDIVREYHGHCIYAGGDDVLALLPLDKAIECSHALAKKFKVTMEGIDLKKLGNINPPTLSVGLGISHFMTPMAKQLNLARKAEKQAKGNDLPGDQPKNSLALIVQPRSGAKISFREKWNYEKPENSAEHILGNWIQAHVNNAISRQVGYNLRDESLSLDWGNTPVPSELISAETARILDAKRNTEGKIKNKWKDKVTKRVQKKGMRVAADELIMTYRIAEAYQQVQTTKEEEGEAKHV